jgi:AraC family transcriptional regulator, transcriptional activator of pobA
MRRFRSLLIEKVNIRVPGLHVMSLAVHRHLAELGSVELHRHASSQALLYLSGAGRQTLSRHKVRVEPGTLVLIPPGIPHSFERSGPKAPLCLAIDFQFRHSEPRGAAVSSLTRSEVALVRQSLADLVRMHPVIPGELPCAGAVLVLQLMLILMRSGGWLPRDVVPVKHRGSSAIAGILTKLEPSTPLGEVVRRSGYQRDHLNSLIKRETGLTLGQHRAGQRLSLAKRLLASRESVSSVATAVGLTDQSYFARWFRKQTGQRPSEWVDPVARRGLLPTSPRQ